MEFYFYYYTGFLVFKQGMYTMNIGHITKDLAEYHDNDYPQAFKLLGLIVFIAQEGSEPLLSGELISTRTFYRWVEKIKQAGYGDLLAETQLKQAVRNFINLRLGDLPVQDAKEQVLAVIEASLQENQA